MRCPQCSAVMAREGFCPACGHLVIEADDNRPAPPAAPPGSAAERQRPGGTWQPAQRRQAVRAHDPSGQVMTASGDYSAVLLGVCCYSLFLHPSLAWLMLVVQTYDRMLPWAVAGIWVPVSYGLTRLLCRVEPDTGRWVIRHRGLRRVFRRLNSLWFGP